MKTITITTLSRSIGEVTTLLVRNERIMLTRNGKPFAVITPVDRAAPKIDKKPTIPAQNTAETKSNWPMSYLGKPLSGKKAKCPVCYEEAPVEFCTRHFIDKHSEL